MSSLKEFAHLQIPLEDIISATNNFSDQNLIREGGFGRIYKGQVLSSGETIDIVARRLDPKYGQGTKEFLTEISMLSSLEHPNLISFIGFCDENEEKIIVNKYEANSSLDKYLSERTLTWMQRLQICAGVARVLSYIYYDKGRDFSIIHRNIKSSKILLDHNWEPKLSGFELSVKNPVTRRDRLLLTALSGTYGYVDPACENTGSVTHKSDVFSLGVVLFEVLCGRRAFIPDENEEPTLMLSMKRLEPPKSLDDRLLSRRLLSHLAKSHYKYGNLDDLIDPDLRTQMEQQSYNIFSETAYRCLAEQRARRPDIDEVVKRLEKALKFQNYYDNNNLQKRVPKEDTSSNHWKAPAVIAKYSFLSRHPLAPEQLPFPSGNPLKNQANGNIMYFSLHEFADLQIPLEDVLSATNNFADENILVHGGVGKLYRGQLKQLGQSIDIVARRLAGMYGQGEIELWTEISMLSSLKHKNLVSIIGFCDENGEKIIIYEHTGHGCLDQHLSDQALTWSQRLQICLGVADALTYIHYDAVHGDIRSSNILIDKDWEAKVFGFGLSTKYPGNWEHRFLFSHYFKTSAYRDPVYTSTLSLTPKYDVYSFGVLLYDVLCGGKPLIIDYGVNGKLDDMIDPHLRKQIDTQSLTIFSKTAYSCLNRHCVQRPSMGEIVKELENVLELQRKPENLEHSTLADEVISSNILTKENIERLKIPLSDIRSATDNFHHTSCIGSGGFGMVYKAELDHLDIQNISPSDWENNKELPKKRSIVAIKRIFNQEGEEGFLAEIETLTSCNHPNIVCLLGFSSEDREMILVFEFVLKGSLDNCLVNNNMANVTWAQRLQICLDVARGLDYLHANLEGKRRIVHRDVKSANVLLDENWNAKVADFGLSKFHPANQQASTIHTVHIVGTEVYLDPEFLTRHTYKKESDIYSFGVVLFEILCGRLAYDPIYSTGNDKGLPTVARRHFIEGTIKELIDPNMMEEANEHTFTVNKGPNQKSLYAFVKIAYQCLAETQFMRPKMEAIIKELQDALNFQGKTFVLMRFRLIDIVSATNSFAAKYCIGVGAYGMMYNAKLVHYDTKSLSEIEGKKGGELPKRHINVALKRIFNREDGNGKQGFFAEIETLASFKHPNIVSLLGVSSENREMIIIYEDAFRGSLHDCLENAPTRAKLTWAKRIQICLDIAHGWTYLQTSTKEKQMIMQFDMNSANILLGAKWRAKIACFWLSTLNSANIDARKVQLNPEYIKIEKLKKESSIYSFGVILFEILCGKLQYDETYYVKNEKGLPNMAWRCFEEGTILNEMIDPNLLEETDENACRLSEEVNEDSFEAFLKIAYGCCAVREADRPSMEVIIKKLEYALTIQDKHLKHLKAQVVETTENMKHLKIPLSDILLATNNFSEQYFIGSGGYAKVYKAELGHFDGTTVEGKGTGELPKRHSTVAIKRMHVRSDKQGEQVFFAELETLSKCKHPNIISLIGFCDEGNELIIVVEYASNGTLDYYLSGHGNMSRFTWIQRIQICLDIAHGLSYLHTGTEDKQPIIHRDVKSSNIVFGDDWVAKIIDFGLSKLNHAYRQFSSIHTNLIVGTEVYLDPEYIRTGWFKKESDIYSFGVVLFEIMCGSLAYDPRFNEERLPSIARKCYEEGQLRQIMDPGMREDETIFTPNGKINQDSLVTFSKVACQCLAEKQHERPNIQIVISELEKAYYFQKNNKDKLHISLKDIQLMTENFSDRKCTGEGRYWKQYEGEMPHTNGYITGVAKRFDSKSDKQRHHFLKELETLFEYKHENVIGVAGYCQDMDEKIIVYEHTSNGRLNEHLDDTSITWMKRLKICIDVACGLHFLHSGGVTKDIPIMHRDIKSASILLAGDWTAKISNLEFSLTSWEREEIEHVTDNAYGSLGYLDPEYEQKGYLTQKSDMYSLGVVLLEMLCGRLAFVEGCEDHSHSLGPLAKQCFKEKKLDELVFEGIKEQINPESLATFMDIALRCLNDDGGERPEAGEVVIQLKKAVELQEDFDIWEPKLPRDYQLILHLSEMGKNTKKKDLYNKLICKGLLLRDREVCLSLGSNGEKHYMISAKKFSHKNHWSHNWRHIPESRFEYVAEMLTLSNLNIKIKIRTWFLSLGVNYGVHLVFKFCAPRKVSVKPMYVNLTYKMESDTLHAYFATWRDEEWMTIELCRFFNHNEDTKFEVLLESFSSSYCGRGAIYVEGIEFRVIDNVKDEEVEKLKEVQQVLKSNSNEGRVQQLASDSKEILRRFEDSEANKFPLNKVNRKKQHMLSAKEVLNASSDVKHFRLRPSAESRFLEVIELLPQQTLRISCKIQSHVLSQDTIYSCYLVFKLSDSCRGLHCPVKVRDPRRNNKEDKNIYFRSPSPWNLHDINHIPEQREDGWMEVNLWNFNILQNDYLWVNLKLISYEGTLAGLIVCGLEFRPM